MSIWSVLFLQKKGQMYFLPIFWLFFVNFFQRYLYMRTFRTILAKKGTNVFFTYFLAIFSWISFNAICRCEHFVQFWRKKGRMYFFPIFWLFFHEFLSTLSVCANVSYNFGEKRNECIFYLFFGYFFLNFFQRYL